MALVSVAGLVLPPQFLVGLTNISTALIDATGEKIAMIGRVWNKDRASKSIRKVGFGTGAIVSAGGSGLTLSLQDVSLTSGPPYQPDGTPDQTVSFLLSALTANSFYTTGNLSADRPVAFGELLAVVIEFDGSGRLGADSLICRGISTSTYLQSGISLFTASWAALLTSPNVIFEFSDGTFGTLDFGFPYSDLVLQAFNSATAAFDEVALEFQTPFACKVDGFAIDARIDSGAADVDVVLYDASDNVLASVSVDANAIGVAAGNRPLFGTFPEVSIAANTTYRLAFKPTTANNVRVPYFEVLSAGHLDATPGGQAFKWANRVNGGAWTTVANRRPHMGIRLSAIDNGFPHPTLRLGM